MAHYANQRTLIIHREDTLHCGKQYLAIECSHLAEAARLLTPSAFKLYLYLASNKEGYEKDFSPQDFSNIYGVSLNAARDAIRSLTEAHYIIDEDNHLTFYETPQQTVSINLSKYEERRPIELDGGGFQMMTYTEFYNILIKDGTPVDIINYHWNKAKENAEEN